MPEDAASGPQPTAPTVPAIQEDTVIVNDNNKSGISNEELQGSPEIQFSETEPITIRDPRTVPESLEGVLTPRNEAGPFVFDGSAGRASGRRVQQLTNGNASGDASSRTTTPSQATA